MDRMGWMEWIGMEFRNEVDRKGSWERRRMM